MIRLAAASWSLPLPSSRGGDNDRGGTKRNQSKSSNADIPVVGEAVDADQASNQCCYKEPGDDSR